MRHGSEGRTVDTCLQVSGTAMLLYGNAWDSFSVPALL